jgi:hypothetical protein
MLQTRRQRSAVYRLGLYRHHDNHHAKPSNTGVFVYAAPKSLRWYVKVRGTEVLRCGRRRPLSTCVEKEQKKPQGIILFFVREGGH